jgi:site-specific DNA recombinase
LNVLASVSQWEREAIGERTKEALGHLRHEGVRLGGEALGWRRRDATDENGRRIVANVKDEAATVRRNIALRAEGLTLRAIADTLRAEGRQTKRGGQWFASTVRAVPARSEVAA